MSDSYEPPADPAGGRAQRPAGDAAPPKTDGGVRRPGADDSVDPGMSGEGGERGADTGGMAGEGDGRSSEPGGMLGEG